MNKVGDQQDLDGNFEIPDGLNDLLHDFAVAVLVERPAQLYEFAAEYFSKEKESRRNKSVPMYIIVDDDEECGEPENIRNLTQRNQQKASRRKSVSAERYNPEEDDSEDELQSGSIQPKTDAERFRLKESMKNILLFRTLDDEQLVTVMNSMTKKLVQPGDVVIRQGDDGDYFYVIDSGVFDVYIYNDQKKESQVNSFENEGSFGELALMYSQPRSATVKARTSGALWAMDRKSFQRIVIKEAYKNRQMYLQLLSEVPFLKPLSDEERCSVVDGLRTKVYYDGECIIKTGDEGDGIYFIEAGVCSVRLDKGKGETELKQLKKGQYFGELALLDNRSRTASVYALGKVKCAFLARDAFERLLGPCRSIMERDTANYEMAHGKK